MIAAFVLFAAAGLTALSCCAVAWALRARQRRRLNEAVHELRRPLQRLALAPICLRDMRDSLSHVCDKEE